MQAKVHKTTAHLAHHHGDGAISRAAMELNPAGDILALRAGQYMRLPQARGWTVQAIAGTVWITQDGDMRDVVLEAGDCIELDRDAPAMFSPLGDVRISLVRDTGHCTKPRAAAAVSGTARPAFA